MNRKQKKNNKNNKNNNNNNKKKKNLEEFRMKKEIRKGKFSINLKAQ